jgi:hypothetical protein
VELRSAADDRERSSTMLKKASLAIVACLAMMGTAHASEDNAGPAGQVPSEAAGEALLGPAVLRVDRTFDETRIDFASFWRVADDVERLDVHMRIDPCEGEGCQKELRFRLICETARGYTQEIESPWYRNYVTQGDTTRTFEFQDARLVDCAYIRSIDVEFRYGWSDESLGSPSGG